MNTDAYSDSYSFWTLSSDVQCDSQVRYDHAITLALSLISLALKLPKVEKICLVGAIAQGYECLPGIEMLSVISTRNELLSCFRAHPAIINFQDLGGELIQFEIQGGMYVRLKFVSDEKFILQAIRLSSSDCHFNRLLEYITKSGLVLNDNAVININTGVPSHFSSEIDFYEKLNLDFIPPVLRISPDSVDLAASHKVATLVSEKMIRGLIHVHSTYSDGKNSLEDMANAVKNLGYEYLGISDHYQSDYFKGMSKVEAFQQLKEIDSLNNKLTPFRIFKGIEASILPDGTLDCDDYFLDHFEFVIASVHWDFELNAAQMTERILKAIKNPRVTILGHPTGRLVLKRKAYEINWGDILDLASSEGVWIELNGNPKRMDMRSEVINIAVKHGIQIPLCIDAHSIADLEFIKYGTLAARRGLLQAASVPNTCTLEHFKKLLKRRPKPAFRLPAAGDI